MRRFLLSWTLFCMTTSAGLIGFGALIAGRADDAPLLMASELAGDCALPCWHGVVLGDTYLSVAHRLLADAGYTYYGSVQGISDFRPAPSGDRACNVRVISTQEERLDGEIDGRVMEIRLLGCEGTPRLGDAMLALRIPQTASTGAARISFLGGAAHVYPRVNACVADQLTPFMRIDAIILTIPRPADDLAQGWHGFGTVSSYRGVCLRWALS